MFGRLKGRALRWNITFMCGMGFGLLGYDQGVMSGIIGANDQFGNDFNDPDANLQGTIVALYDIGCAVGALFAFAVGERVGRKRMITAGGIIMLLGTAILASSTTLAQLLVGRLVTGFGNGFNATTIPVYQSETCPAAVRGMLVCLQSTITIVGLVIAYWIDYGLSFVNGPVQWRFPVAFQAVFALSLAFQTLLLPDTPRWLLERGRREDALQVLSDLYADDPPLDEDHDSTTADAKLPPDSNARALAECDEIERSLEYEREVGGGHSFRFSELWEGGKGGNWRRVGLSCGVLVMQQATGSNMINYYAPVVYENAMGLSRNMALILGGCTSITYMVASFIPLWTVDRFGRRTLLLISSAGLAFCFYMTALLLGIAGRADVADGHPARVTALGAAATAFVFLFQVFLGIGWLPIPWLYPSEVSTTRIRSKAAALGVFCNWMAVFVVVKITPIAIANISWRTFLIFGSFNLAFLPILYCFFPETSRLTLEEIDRLFEKGGFTGGVYSSKGGRTVEPGSGTAQVAHSNRGTENARLGERKGDEKRVEDARGAPE